MMVGCRTAARAALVAAALLGLSAVAAAEVVLDTAVSKVETTLDGGGQVKRELVPVEDVVPGEELRYSISFTNDSPVAVDAGRIVITNPIPDGTSYVAGSAGGADARVEYSVDGDSFAADEPPAGAGGAGDGVSSVRWTYERELAPGDSAEVFFHVRIQ